MFGSEKPPEVKAGIEDADASGRTALVTGSTSGLGRAAALALGRLGADVIVHGRNREAGETVVADLEAVGSDARFVAADFEKPAEVSALAETVRNEVDDLDVLCNNAGGRFEDNAETEPGVGRTFHINHLSPYQLTVELLPVLGDGARVVTTASVGHRIATLNLDRLAEMTGLSSWAAYCRSKLANILFASELSRRLVAAGRNVTSNSLHPGIVPGSEFSRALPDPAPQIGRLIGEFPTTDSVEDGAATIVYRAVSDDVEGVTGKYFARCRERRPAPDAVDAEAGRELWARSADLLGIEEPLAETAAPRGPARPAAGRTSVSPHAPEFDRLDPHLEAGAVAQDRVGCRRGQAGRLEQRVRPNRRVDGRHLPRLARDAPDDQRVVAGRAGPRERRPTLSRQDEVAVPLDTERRN